MGKVTAGLLLVLCVIFTLFIFAADRLYFRVRALERRLESLESRLSNGIYLPEAQADKLRDGSFANVEYMDPERAYGSVLRIAISADMPNLNPVTSMEAEASRLHSFCTHSLAERNYGNIDVFEPVLAESWESSPDGLRFRIKLRQGVYWHDFTDPESGKEYRNVEMTADDFAFYFQAVNDPAVNCAHLRSYYQGVEECRVLGRYEFEIIWKEPYFKLEEMTLGLSPLPRHYYCPEGIWDPEKFNYDAVRNAGFIGVGPYRLESRQRDVSLSLVRCEDYFGREYGAMPGIERIELVVNKLDTSRFQGLLAGELDMISLTPDQWIRRTEDNERFGAMVKVGDAAFDAANVFGEEAEEIFVRCLNGGMSYSYIGWNLQSPLFRDAETRNALTMLVNRERLLQDIYYGLGTIASGPLNISDPAVEPLPFDPGKAAELLRSVGWQDSNGNGILDRDGVEFSFAMMQTANNSIQEKILPVIKEEFARAGIEMRIDIYEWSVFIERIQSKKFDACMLGWTMPLAPDPYQVWHSSQADIPETSNFIGFRNREADRIIEEIRTCTEPERLNDLYLEFQMLLHKEQPYTFMFIPASLSAVSGKFNNVRLFRPSILPETLLWSPF